MLVINMAGLAEFAGQSFHVDWKIIDFAIFIRSWSGDSLRMACTDSSLLAVQFSLCSDVDVLGKPLLNVHMPMTKQAADTFGL